MELVIMIKMAITSRHLVNLAMCFTLLALSIAAKASANTSQSYSAHKIKTVYVYRLANFIRWPSPQPQPLRYCVLGRNSITVTLDTFFSNVEISSPLVHMTDLTAASQQCDVLYITEQKLNILQAIPQYPNLLTISDSPQFLERGGMIELRTYSSQIKPVLALTHLERSNLSVSSQLLRIAIIHRPQKPDNARGGNHE
ncbi:YfiR family protein [Photobacterium makurazakiensis]|uniref:YfiR family protein n=1 Tax=Photobacterium makurazakiensis TaxID=2910234 RepID=UPI003D10BC4A